MVTVIRAFQEWTYRTPRQFIGLRSRLSLGINALDSTTNSHGLPDSRFFSWLVQGRWSFRRSPSTCTRSSGSTLELTPDSLLPLEEASIGGRYTVGGYLENQLVRRTWCVRIRIETRFPIVRNKPWATILDLCAFYDFGHSWHTDFPARSQELSTAWALAYGGASVRGIAIFTPSLSCIGYSITGPWITKEVTWQEKGIGFRFLIIYW